MSRKLRDVANVAARALIDKWHTRPDAPYFSATAVSSVGISGFSAQDVSLSYLEVWMSRRATIDGREEGQCVKANITEDALGVSEDDVAKNAVICMAAAIRDQLGEEWL